MGGIRYDVYGIPVGFRIVGPSRNSAPDRANLRDLDVISSINGHPTRSYFEVAAAIAAVADDHVADFRIIRKGRRLVLKVPLDQTWNDTLGYFVSRLPPRSDGMCITSRNSFGDLLTNSLGVAIDTSTVKLHHNFDQNAAPNGFRLTGIVRNTLLDRIGLRNGDVVHAIDGRRLVSIQAIGDIIEAFDPDQTFVTLQLIRNERTLVRRIYLDETGYLEPWAAPESLVDATPK